MRWRSYSPSPPRSYRRRGWTPSPRGHYGRHSREDLPRSLLVGNLRHGCREPRGFAFVQYIDPAVAAEAKYQMDGQILLGRELTVVFAEENRNKPSDIRGRERVRSMLPEDQKHHRGRSYLRSPSYDDGSRSRSPYEDGKRERSRSHRELSQSV